MDACITRSESGSYSEPSLFHFNVEFCHNLVQSLRAETLNLVVNISHFQPFHPYCQPCLCGLLCVCLQPTCLSQLSLILTQLENGTLQVQVVMAREHFHLEQNATVALYQITELGVFLFVELARALMMPWSPLKRREFDSAFCKKFKLLVDRFSSFFR